VSPSSQAVPRLLLVIADIASQRRRLTQALLDHHEARNLAVRVVDLAGDLNLARPPSSLEHCDVTCWAERIWQQLLPPLAPWLELLELDAAGAEPPPLRTVPGLDAVLRALFLAQCWQNLPEGHSLVVILPPPDQALEILQLLRRGPDLLEGLWKPLLDWWALTRQRLAQFELVLRLKLPTADSLELSPDWRARLQQLARRLADDEQPVEVLLGLALEQQDLPLLDTRIAALPLSGQSHLRLWLDTHLPDAALKAQASQWQLPLLVAASEQATPQFSAWLDKPLTQPARLWSNDATGMRCRLFLPGVSREGLQVRQREQQVRIHFAGLRLELTLPADGSQLTCCSARVEAPWLKLGFS